MQARPRSPGYGARVSELASTSTSPRSKGRHFSVSAGLETDSVQFTTLTSAFYAQARVLWSSGIAVCDLSGDSGGEGLTYRDLAERVQALSHRLHIERIKKGQRIPLVAKRGLQSVTSILAILSCGAQFVPVDYEIQSDDYLRRVVEWSGQRIVLSTSLGSDIVLERVFPSDTHMSPIRIVRVHSEIKTRDLDRDSAMHNLATPDDPGAPWDGSVAAKEVHIKHRNMVNLVCLGSGDLGVYPGAKVGQTLSISSDIAVWEIFGCLCNGGTLIEVLITTPTLLSRYEPEQLPELKVLATAGEAISDYLADKWAACVPAVWKCYGFSETTIVCALSLHHITNGLGSRRCGFGLFSSGCPVLSGRDGVGSVGYPIPNLFLYVLDDNGRKRAIGYPGRIWVGGRGVSDQYISYGRHSYVTNPFRDDGSTMYRTEDCGICHEDGSIELLPPVPSADYARSRHELSAVELQRLTSAWSCTAGTTQIAVLACGLQMHFFRVQQHIEDVNQEEWRCSKSMDEHLKILQQRGQMPAAAYIDPKQFHTLAEIPVGPDGKLDRGKLLREVIRHETRSPPGVIGSMVDIPSSATLPKSVIVTAPVSRRRKREPRAAVQGLLAKPAELFRNLKGSGR
ncbi:NRPS-like enzyme, partial [Metarhizium hybridum]